MRFKNRKRIHYEQGGFTLVETLVGLVIIGVISTALTTGITQVFSGSSLSSEHMTAVNNVRNAGDWISQDARMAENTIIITSNLPSMHWTFFNPLSGDPPSVHDVVYTLSGTDLVRSYTVDSGVPQVTTVAQNITIDSAVFSGNKLTIALTATVGSASETRTFVISLRNLPQ